MYDVRCIMYDGTSMYDVLCKMDDVNSMSDVRWKKEEFCREHGLCHLDVRR